MVRSYIPTTHKFILDQLSQEIASGMMELYEKELEKSHLTINAKEVDYVSKQVIYNLKYFMSQK